MRKGKVLSLIACACALTTFLSGCVGVGGSLLAKPARAEELHYSEYKQEEFVAFKVIAEEFSAKLVEGIYKRSDKDDNLSVAPMSVFMALLLVSECASGDTKTEILNALGVSENAIDSHLPTLYRALNVEYESVGIASTPTTGLLKTTNSIWIDKGVSYKKSCVDMLANNYYCYPYQADFKNKNALANYAVRSFVKEQSNGLIDEDFKISDETLFTFINTMYLKALWNAYGDKIPLTTESYNFVERSGEVETTKLMKRGFIEGRAFEGETYTSFYTTTYDGFKLKFLLPKENYTIDDVFTAENIFEANSVTDYDSIDEEKMEQYFTRCFFPEYEAECDENISRILMEDFGINSLFDWGRCELNELTDEKVVCAKVQHITELSVDRRGIEGAAVTHIPGAGAPGPGPYTRVELDFIVDRAFGFIITDKYNTTLFAGVVNEID